MRTRTRTRSKRVGGRTLTQTRSQRLRQHNAHRTASNRIEPHRTASNRLALTRRHFALCTVLRVRRSDRLNVLEKQTGRSNVACPARSMQDRSCERSMRLSSCPLFGSGRGPSFWAVPRLHSTLCADSVLCPPSLCWSLLRPAAPQSKPNNATTQCNQTQTVM
jgi:hypothetical protein